MATSNVTLQSIKKTYSQNGGESSHATANSSARKCGIRYLETGIMALLSFMSYSLQSTMNVAIVVMVKNKGISSINYSTYDWNENAQSLVLSSFFWGYAVTQIPAGILSERFGGHKFLCASILVSSVLTVILPFCAMAGGWELVCVNRMLQGMSQGFVYPSIYTLLGMWSPPDERGRLASISLGAQLVGTVVTTPLSGLLCSACGWPSVFYCFGALGGAVTLVSWALGADSPATHTFIKEVEINYIQSSLGGAKEKIKVPWKLILTSFPVWAAMVSAALNALVFLTFSTMIPTYMDTVLKFNIKENGALSALPFLACWICSFIFSLICDCIINRGWLKLTTARKLFMTLANFGSAIFVVLMAYAVNAVMSVILLTAFFGFLAADYPGVQSNLIDLAPNLAGPIFSVSNFFGAFLGLTGPVIVGFIVTTPGSTEQWSTVFFLTAAVLIVSDVIFVLLGTAETQWWNWPNRKEGTDNNIISKKNGNNGSPKEGDQRNVD